MVSLIRKKILMKKCLLISVFFFVAMSVFAQEEVEKSYVFTMKKQIEATPVKDQHRSGTCWDYATVALLEAELLRNTGSVYDLSEGFYVYHTYYDKAVKYARYHGNSTFSPGGMHFDVLECLKKYGAIPETVYTGTVPAGELFNHGELFRVMKGYLDGLLKNGSSTLSTNWKNGFAGILNAYIGTIPETFDYEGTKYTPESFGANLKINPDDYIVISSYTHHPFYDNFIVDIPDNWLNGYAYNLPLDEMMEVINYALDNDYTFCWDADVSDKGFSWKNGVAIVPDRPLEYLSGTDYEKWNTLSDEEKTAQMYVFDGSIAEKNVTQEMRQELFDNQDVTDDHLMLVTGYATDANDNVFYMVKNSWGDDSGKFENGYMYASEQFMKKNTISLMLNKNALPKNIAKKLGLK